MSPHRSLPAALAALAASILLLAALPSPVHGLVLDSGRCDANTLPSICANATKARYCWPCSTSKFVACDGAGGGAVRTCAAGKRFDYGLRRCVATAYAKTCTNWRCPPGDYVLGQDGFSTMIGTPVGFAPANATIDITEPGSFYVICPVHGHCQGGMIFRVTAMAAPPGYTPKVYPIDWVEPLTNADLYPKRYEDINAYVGDKVHLEWDEVIHAVVTFTPSASSVASVPGPPQPVYKCPTWSVDAQGNTIPLPGETVMTAPGPFGNVSYTATAPDEFWAVCNIGPHCRVGMIYKITVMAAPAGYSPAHHIIHWTSNNFDNFPDMTVYVGDTMTWLWASMPALRPTDPSFSGLRTQDIQFHQLSFIRGIQKY